MPLRILHAGLQWEYWGRLEPDCLDRPDRSQIAGGETAMLRAAFETAARGHEVHVATWCYPGRHRGVSFHESADLYDLALGGGWDAVVSWGDPEILAALTGAGALGGALRVCAQQCNGFARPDAVQGYVDTYVSPSRSHARMLAARYRIPEEKFAVIPNGVEPSRFRFGEERNPQAVYHASSPDRGLHHLLELWPEVRRERPGATLDVCYDYERFFRSVRGEDSPRYSHPIMLDLVQRLEAAMRRVWHGQGVTFHGAMPQQAVADLACRSGVMAYPCDPVTWTEGYGTAVLESFCAGAAVVTTDADAFGEVYGDLFPLIPRGRIREDLVPAILGAMDEMERRRGKAGWKHDALADLRAEQERHSWRRIGGMWCDLIESRSEKKIEAIAT